MNIIKNIFILIILVATISSKAQPPLYKKEWKQVDAFIENNMTSSAINTVKYVLTSAIDAKLDAQQLKAVMHLMAFKNNIDDESRKNNYYFIDSEIVKSISPAKNVLLSMQAEYLNAYLDQNRYTIYERTKLAEDNKGDFETWDISKIQSKISSLYLQSLENSNLLKQTPIEQFDAILEKGENTRLLRPTLFDFLGHRALDYFTKDERDVTQPSFAFVINDERAFGSAENFTSTSFKVKDRESNYYQALLLFQSLTDFHLKDIKPNALADLNLKRFDFVYEKGAFENKDKLYEACLQNMEQDAKLEKEAHQAMYLRAQLYYKKGTEYEGNKNPLLRWQIRNAKLLCDTIINTFTGTEGAINATNLLQQINEPSINTETEKTVLPSLPFKGLITYKNTPKVYYRIIQITQEETISLWKNGSEQIRASILEKKAQREGSFNLPGNEDFQTHATEFKIEPLQNGIYLLIVSSDSNFSTSNNCLTQQTFFVSEISYVSNENEYYVLDRETGKPLNNAGIQIWQTVYDPELRQNKEQKAETYVTDKNGHFTLSQKKEYRNIQLDITYGKDRLYIPLDQFGQTNYTIDEPYIQSSTFLFTDRSMYRPGQKVYFKGIVISKNIQQNKSEIKVNFKTRIRLLDANSQEVAFADVITGNYGSFNGSFILPKSLMNGEFSLTDSITSSSIFIHVEDYKRPKFEVEINNPSGTYRVNDSIKVKGNTKSYAGANITGAKVIYRVKRTSYYPYWYRGWGPYNQNKIEITNGELATDSDGEFTITFKAIPDETIEKNRQPVFNYEISADVTDINGETRSSSNSVSVSYQAIQLQLQSPKDLVKDSIDLIKIITNNTAGTFEKINVYVTMERLVAPLRILRDRLWDNPDQFIMTREAHNQAFPNDPYDKEYSQETWDIAEKIFDIQDSSQSTGLFSLPSGQKLKTGWYKIKASAKDKFNESVTSEVIIFIKNSAEEVNPLNPLTLSISKNRFAPGEKAIYTIATNFKEIWMISNIAKPASLKNENYFTLLSSKPYKNNIDITEKDRGGINISYLFVKDNRFYSGNETVIIPWTNKELEITYTTFRDKLLPGSEEKWKIKIKGKEGEKLATEALASMYDASLNQFKEHSWQQLSSLWPDFNYLPNWNSGNFSKITSAVWSQIYATNTQSYTKYYDALSNIGWNVIDNYQFRARGGFADDQIKVAYNNLASAKQEETKLVLKIEDKNADGTYADITKLHFTGPSIIKNRENAEQPNKITIRKNFNETAFFLPELHTDSSGNIEFAFTIPEALTQWKLMLMAHTQELASGYSEKNIITQKSLMIQPNAPRFLREGDHIEFPSKITNLETKELTGKASLELFDVTTGNSVDGWFRNVFPVQYFTIAPGQSTSLSFSIDLPYTFTGVLGYRVKAITTDKLFSDGEESQVPILSNRILVTESLPMSLRKTRSKGFTFDKLLSASNNGTLTHQGITVEYSTNPIWYVVQSLPYIIEYPFECAEQSFNRFYANTLASFVGHSNPRIQDILKKWSTTDTSALLSNLEKNEELKQVLLEETPWVLEAKNENEQKKRISLLFDMVRMGKDKENTLTKLKELQSSNGGFAWFKGGPDDQYITQYILSGIGHLKKLNAIEENDNSSINDLVKSALLYADNRIKDEYDQLIKNKSDLRKNNLSNFAIQYIYMRSFFSNIPITEKSKKVHTYFIRQAEKYWTKQNKYLQGMIGLAIHRENIKSKTPKLIIASLKENALYKDEMGMYWKEFAKGGYYWYQAPIESQALMIEAFSDIDGNNNTIDDLKTWLLKNKQTNNWGSTKATSEACYALLIGGSKWVNQENNISIQLGDTKLTPTSTEAGTGYFKQFIPGDKVKQEMGNIHISIQNQDTSSTTPSWGSVYWQYFEDADKITNAATPLQLNKQLFIEKNTDRGPELVKIKEGDELHIGDKIKVRIELRSDRNMEYVHMKDMRGACMEPVNVLSQYKYQDGLGYYESTRDASTQFFFSYLPKGTYVFEYPIFVAQAGQFSNGITTIQCMYAPEFSSHSNGMKVVVAP